MRSTPSACTPLRTNVVQVSYLPGPSAILPPLPEPTFILVHCPGFLRALDEFLHRLDDICPLTVGDVVSPVITTVELEDQQEIPFARQNFGDRFAESLHDFSRS